MRLVLASANPDKAAEISAILAAAVPDLDLAPRPADVPDVDETGATLLENARLKAAAIAAATGEPAVADDTGLLVDALDGAPGVCSARFAGEDATYADNVAKLLAELAGVAARAAHRPLRDRGPGPLARRPGGGRHRGRGGRHRHRGPGDRGFGYDPLFVPTEGDGRTFAELLPMEKHALSHRGRAFRALAAELAKLY